MFYFYLFIYFLWSLDLFLAHCISSSFRLNSFYSFLILGNVGEKEASNSCLLTGERDWNRFNFFLQNIRYFMELYILRNVLHLLSSITLHLTLICCCNNMISSKEILLIMF